MKKFKEIKTEIDLYLAIEGGDVQLQQMAKESPAYLHQWIEHAQLEMEMLRVKINLLSLCMAKVLSDYKK